MLTMIYSAIRERTMLEISHRGQGLREVEPRRLEFVPGNRALLYTFQTGGFSRSGLVRGWKVFDLDEITHVRCTDRHFDAERPAPTRDEAHDLVALCLEREVTQEEVVRALGRAGAPRSWIEEIIAAWRAPQRT